MDDLSPDSALPPAGSAQDNDAPRQLVVCIDGTSNRFGDQPTNVVRLYRSLSRDPRRVLAYYRPATKTSGPARVAADRTSACWDASARSSAGR